MAKKFLTKKEIFNLSRKQLDNMDEKELRKVVSSARSIARKRYERLEKKGIQSPAMGLLMKHREKEGYDIPFPTVNKMDKITLRNELRRYMGFIGAKSSTIPGAKEIMEKSKQAIFDITGVQFDDKETVDFWHIVDRAKQTEVGKVLHYTQIQAATAEAMENNKELSNEELIEKVKTKLQEVYEAENPTNTIYPSEYYNQTPH